MLHSCTCGHGAQDEHDDGSSLGALGQLRQHTERAVVRSVCVIGRLDDRCQPCKDGSCAAVQALRGARHRSRNSRDSGRRHPWQHSDVDPVRLRNAVRVDLDTVVGVWVEAFVHDPYFRWIAPTEDGYVAFARHWMTFIAELAFERGHTYIDLAGQVATAWIPPDLSLVTVDNFDRARAIVAEHAGEVRAGHALTTIIAARAHDMNEPHWTLQYIGVRAASHGRGLGAMAVAPLIERCNADGVPCGLVSTNPRNIAFYERLGFVAVAEVPTPDGVAVLRPMHRPCIGR